MQATAFRLTLAIVTLTSVSNPVHADTFGTGDDTFEIEFVTIGNPGNSPDTTGDPNPAGAVDYVYRHRQVRNQPADG